MIGQSTDLKKKKRKKYDWLSWRTDSVVVDYFSFQNLFSCTEFRKSINYDEKTAPVVVLGIPFVCIFQAIQCQERMANIDEQNF